MPEAVLRGFYDAINFPKQNISPCSITNKLCAGINYFKQELPNILPEVHTKFDEFILPLDNDSEIWGLSCVSDLDGLIKKYCGTNSPATQKIKEEMVVRLLESGFADQAPSFRLHGAYDFLHPETKLRLSYIPRGNRYFVGDLHGDWNAFYSIVMRLASQDVFAKMEKHEPIYLIFLGDYVDRGTHSLDVLLGVLTLKLLFPLHVIMLRGNHEHQDVCFMGGLLQQLMGLYPKEYEAIFNNLVILFSLLPIIALSADGIMAVHGGPPFIAEDEHVLKLFNFLDKKHTYVSYDLDGKFDFINMLWNDPAPIEPREYYLQKRYVCIYNRGYFEPNIYRGYGFLFTNQIWRYYRPLGIQKIIRGHEIKASAVDACHPIVNDVITVFSTGGLNNNTSGYKTVQNPYFLQMDWDLHPRFESVF